LAREGQGLEAYAAVAAGTVDRDALLRDHAKLVKKVAYRIVSRLPESVDVEDLISAGMVGLLTAADRFDPSRGPFEAFAEWRIKGAILDELRTFDHLTRTQRQKASKVQKVRQRLEHQLGRQATVEELADAGGLDEEEVRHALHATEGPIFVNLDDLGLEREDVSDVLAAVGGRQVPPNPSQHLLLQELKQRLVTTLGTLPEREQTILSLYYADELNYREIGEVMELTESRICQIVRKSLKTLAKRMRD